MTRISGVIIDKQPPFGDFRGRFIEVARMSSVPFKVQQVGHSRSNPGVLRGLHFHRKQFDLWFLARGRVQLGLADLRQRPQIPSQLRILEEGARVIIPPGVAHGYLALDEADVIYLASETYDPEDEYGVAWNDPQIGLGWMATQPILSERDRNNPIVSWHDIPTF